VPDTEDQNEFFVVYTGDRQMLRTVAALRRGRDAAGHRSAAPQMWGDEIAASRPKSPSPRSPRTSSSAPPSTGSEDNWVGEIGELALTEDGEIEAVIVDVGGFLGIGRSRSRSAWTRSSFAAAKAAVRRRPARLCERDRGRARAAWSLGMGRRLIGPTRTMTGPAQIRGAFPCQRSSSRRRIAEPTPRRVLGDLHEPDDDQREHRAQRRHQPHAEPGPTPTAAVEPEARARREAAHLALREDDHAGGEEGHAARHRAQDPRRGPSPRGRRRPPASAIISSMMRQ
jgi:hypothetical protein